MTGATGFIGRAVATAAHQRGWAVRATVRTAVNALPREFEASVVGTLSAQTRWHEAVVDVDVVVHCAARVHVLAEKDPDPLAAFRAVNVESTLALARAACDAGVRRLVFLSSIGVNGTETSGTPFTPFEMPAPRTPYAQSKREAEEGLLAIQRQRGFEVVIIRPPLVYGPAAPGNFARLVSLLRHRVPLPLGALRNRRSMVGVDNLVDLVLTCLDHPRAAGETFLVSDDQDVSTAEFLRRAGRALGTGAWLPAVPLPVLRWAAHTLGRDQMLQQLCGSLQLDISATRATLGWSPPVTLDEGLARALRPARGTRP